MRKFGRFIAVFMVLCCLVVSPSMAFAADTSAGDFNPIVVEVSKVGTVHGAVDSNQGGFSVKGLTPVKFSHTAATEKKLLVKEWRATSTLSILTANIYWDLYLDVYLWKDDHAYTSNSDRNENTSTLTVNTKWVSGTSGGQFDVHANGVVRDDAGTVVYNDSQSSL